MEERGGRFFPGRANDARKARVAEALKASPHPELARLRPEILGEGKGRTVFELSREKAERGGRGVVVKVDRGACEVAVRDILRTGLPDISKETRETLSNRLVRERFARKDFQNAFQDFALPERCFLRKIPLPTSAIREFLPDISLPEKFPNLHEITTLVYVQERAPAAAFAQESHEFVFRCPERDPEYAEDTIFRANQAFLDLHAPWNEIPALPGFGPEFRAIFSLIRQDGQLKAVIADLLKASHDYLKETGNVLDFLGADNARLYKNEKGDWKLLLLDAYTPGRAFAQAQEALRALAVGYEITDNEALAVMGAVNYARGMNALALVSNAPQRFRLSQGDVALILRKLLPYMRKKFALSK